MSKFHTIRFKKYMVKTIWACYEDSINFSNIKELIISLNLLWYNPYIFATLCIKSLQYPNKGIADNFSRNPQLQRSIHNGTL